MLMVGMGSHVSPTVTRSAAKALVHAFRTPLLRQRQPVAAHCSALNSCQSAAKHAQRVCTPCRLLSHRTSTRTCNSAAAAASTATAEPGDFVQVHYTGTLEEDGSEFDSSRGRDPLEFIIGAGKVIQGFNDAVTGLAVGEQRKQSVSPEKGYGEWRADMKVSVPKGNSPDGLTAGAVVQLSNGMQARILEVTDKEVTFDANHELAGKTLMFDVELIKLVKGSQLETATFAAGCFWGPELRFQRVPGVLSTKVGYSQADRTDLTYEEVCLGQTGAAEVVQVVYDPAEAPYRKLVDVFLNGHDPTQLNQQGGDVGTQYRSGIYWHNPEQKRVAEEAMAEAQKDYQAPIVTELEEIKNFAEAEVYHQQYLARGGRFGQPQNPSKGCDDPIRCYG